MYEEDEDEEQPVVGAVSWAVTTNDEWYLGWHKKVLEEPNTYPRWNVLGGQLYMYYPNQDIEEDLGVDDDAWEQVFPSEERKKLLLECHDDPTAGHLGREKTFARVARYYYWPRYYQSVRKHVRTCLNASSLRQNRGPLWD